MHQVVQFHTSIILIQYVSLFYHWDKTLKIKEYWDHMMLGTWYYLFNKFSYYYYFYLPSDYWIFVVQVPWFCKGCSEWEKRLLYFTGSVWPLLEFYWIFFLCIASSFIGKKSTEVTVNFIFELPCSSGSDRKVRWREKQIACGIWRGGRDFQPLKKVFSSRDIQFWPSPPTYPGQTLLISQHSLPTKQKLHQNPS